MVLVERVRRLVALAADTRGNINERQVAALNACELIQKMLDNDDRPFDSKPTWDHWDGVVRSATKRAQDDADFLRRQAEARAMWEMWEDMMSDDPKTKEKRAYSRGYDAIDWYKARGVSSKR
jgi:hypothetical protein